MSIAEDRAPRHRCLEAIDCFVLAGGLGTRLRPLLHDLPKLLAPIAGRPFLAYLMDWLAGFGARRVVLGLGWQAQAVLDYLCTNPPRLLEVVPVVEPQPLGTAGAIRFARRELNSDPVLVVNGDSLVDADLSLLLAQHRRRGARATLLCTEVADASRYGRVLLDGNDRIRGFVEKDSGFRGTATISTGVYLISAALADEIAGGTAASLERDVFQRLRPGSLATMAGAFDFIDIGTPASLERAPQFMRSFRFQREATDSPV
jgi:mannose-1-phosphate guanylyltransferase